MKRASVTSADDSNKSAHGGANILHLLVQYTHTHTQTLTHRHTYTHTHRHTHPPLDIISILLDSDANLLTR